MQKVRWSKLANGEVNGEAIGEKMVLLAPRCLKDSKREDEIQPDRLGNWENKQRNKHKQANIQSMETTLPFANVLSISPLLDLKDIYHYWRLKQRKTEKPSLRWAGLSAAVVSSCFYRTCWC